MSTISELMLFATLSSNSKRLFLGNTVTLRDKSNAKQETLIGLAVPLSGLVESTADQIIIT